MNTLLRPIDLIRLRYRWLSFGPINTGESDPAMPTRGKGITRWRHRTDKAMGWSGTVAPLVPCPVESNEGVGHPAAVDPDGKLRIG